MPLDLASLKGYTEAVIVQNMPDGRVLEWQVHPITASAGARAGIGLSAVQAAVAGSAGATDADEGGAPPEPVRLDLQKLADLGEYSERLCIVGVRAVRDQGDTEWTPIRLAAEANDRANPVRLPVAMLQMGRTPDGAVPLNAVAAAAGARMQEAAESAGTFRGSE
jgi:hypothetical protein